MRNIIERFLPNLLPGLGAFANPWVLVGLLASLIAAFFYGMHVEHAKLEAFEAKVAAIGEAQNQRTVQRIKDDKRIKQEVDRGYTTNAGRLAAANADLERRLRAGAGGSFVPAAPASAASPSRATLDRAQLEGALRSFTADTAQLIGEGDSATLKLNAARDWAAQTRKLP